MHATGSSLPSVDDYDWSASALGAPGGWPLPLRIAADLLLKTSGQGPYAAQAQAMAASLKAETSTNRNSPPSVIADAIAKAVTASKPKTRYAVGFGARPLISARRLLGDRQFDALISRAVGMPRS